MGTFERAWQNLPSNLGLRHEHDEYIPSRRAESFVDEQVSQRGYGTSSEYVRELIRKDQERQQLRGLLLAGAASAVEEPADADYFARLRERVGEVARSRRKA